jgi:hypothetical protein
MPGVHADNGAADSGITPELEGFFPDDRVRIEDVFLEQQDAVIQRRVLLEQAQVVGDRLAGEIARVMATHTIGNDPHVLVIMHQNRIFVPGSDMTGIGNAVAVYLEAG